MALLEDQKVFAIFCYFFLSLELITLGQLLLLQFSSYTASFLSKKLVFHALKFPNSIIYPMVVNFKISLYDGKYGGS